MTTKSAPPCLTKAPRTFSKEESCKWAQRVYEAQNARLSPQERQMLQERAERNRNRQLQCKKVKSISTKSVGLRCKTWTGMAQLQEARMSAPPASSGAMQLAITNQVVADMNDDDALEAEGADENLVQVTTEDITKLLAEVQKEPPTEEETQAKFTLYENYAQKVETIRKDMFDFWNENQVSFPDAPRKSVESIIQGIDQTDRMAIYDQSRYWFVYDMMKKADENHNHIESILKEIQRKLDFLAKSEQCECPICLEKFEEEGDRAPITLGCCHQVCGECWDHWRGIRGGAAFCPMCRNSDFVTELHAFQQHA
eukprot:TRINITY_DN66502_c6_g4_i1.p1 TRINITY_DN66502_c6_g4~~TRINITY_DN66502_c6_g4_i1.p1  ORF type:complete len:312 (-),score=61.94 TRINITY_DN66502_c6_g4_i1:568-1503(-)